MVTRKVKFNLEGSVLRDRLDALKLESEGARLAQCNCEPVPDDHGDIIYALMMETLVPDGSTNGVDAKVLLRDVFVSEGASPCYRDCDQEGFGTIKVRTLLSDSFACAGEIIQVIQAEDDCSFEPVNQKPCKISATLEANIAKDAAGPAIIYCGTDEIQVTVNNEFCFELFEGEQVELCIRTKEADTCPANDNDTGSQTGPADIACKCRVAEWFVTDYEHHYHQGCGTAIDAPANRSLRKNPCDEIANPFDPGETFTISMACGMITATNCFGQDIQPDDKVMFMLGKGTTGCDDCGYYAWKEGSGGGGGDCCCMRCDPVVCVCGEEQILELGVPVDYDISANCPDCATAILTLEKIFCYPKEGDDLYTRCEIHSYVHCIRWDFSCSCIATSVQYCAICSDDSRPSGTITVDSSSSTIICGVAVNIDLVGGELIISYDGVPQGALPCPITDCYELTNLPGATVLRLGPDCNCASEGQDCTQLTVCVKCPDGIFERHSVPAGGSVTDACGGDFEIAFDADGLGGSITGVGGVPFVQLFDVTCPTTGCQTFTGGGATFHIGAIKDCPPCNTLGGIFEVTLDCVEIECEVPVDIDLGSCACVITAGNDCACPCGCLLVGSVPYCAFCEDDTEPSGVLTIDGGEVEICGVTVKLETTDQGIAVYENGDITRFLACEFPLCSSFFLLCPDFHNCDPPSPGLLKLGTACECECCCVITGPVDGQPSGPFWVINSSSFDCVTGDWMVTATAAAGAGLSCVIAETLDDGGQPCAVGAMTTACAPGPVAPGQYVFEGTADLSSIPCTCRCNASAFGQWSLQMVGGALPNLSFQFTAWDCREVTTAMNVLCIIE